jgi:phosphoribosylformimino-5-aminoimidazole carboxamide ribotide isomerase
VWILPAIDLRGGRCVRLRQGDYAQETVFADDPVAMARHWVAEGARALHVVDLDGAREGRPFHADTLPALIAAAGVPCQVGGGLRRQEDIAQVLSWGAARAVLGTRALEDLEWLAQMSQRFPGRLLVSLDVRDGWLATAGWRQTTCRRAEDLAPFLEGLPLAGVVYTDISRDGMLQGPNLEALAALVARLRLPVLASGGITTVADVQRLASLGVAGCIIGRALYEGRLRLADLAPWAAVCEDGASAAPRPNKL